MFRFGGHVFKKVDAQWFIWEPHWDSFRPIDGFGWNGVTYEVMDTTYTTDPFSDTFGYGTLEMQKICQEITDASVQDIDSAPEVSFALVGAPTWVRDRWVVLANPDAASTWRKHLSYIRSRAHTCRKVPRGQKTTKRILLSDKICAST